MTISPIQRPPAAAVHASVAVKAFVKKPLMLALAALAFSTAAPAFAANWWSATPPTVTGKTTIDVRSKGALGNGTHNDTAAFQAAVDALPADGGTVYVPAGHYMIDPLKSVSMRSHTRLLMDGAATLEAIPTSASRYWVVKVWDVTDVRIVGGNIVGERARHIGSTGQWGYGINIQGAKNVVVKNVRVSNCWGDGILIGATGWGKTLKRSDYVTVTNTISSNNRRQGLTIGPAQHVYIVNSRFQNSMGTLPEAGIDIEPQDQGPANTIRLEKNVFANNHGNGIELHANISDLAIVGNTMTGNRGFGVLGVTAPYVTVSGNTMNRNGLAGVGASGKSHHWQITGNTLQFNSTRYVSPTRTGGGLDRDLQIGANTSEISVSNNLVSDAKFNSFKQ